MKRIINLLLILAFLGLSGCWTKIYLSEQKEREQESILKDDVPPLLKAIKPTVISPGGTWGTVRSIINTNFSNINGTLDSIEHNIDVHDDSLTAHRIAINLRLLKSDTASMLQRYARQSALNTALAGKQNTLVSGTNIKTINNQSILGTGNIEITGGGETMIYPSAGIPTSTGSAWGTSITNNSTNWDTAYSERLRWDGSSTGLNAATGRTSLGATEIGSNLFTLNNPNSQRYLRTNNDNTIATISATTLKEELALDNVTNESKATMFTNPTFTGTAVRWGTDTLATQAYARTQGGGGEGEGVWGGITGTLSDQTDLQSALNAKAPTVSPTFTISATLPAATSIGNVSSTEISYLDGASSNIQAQLNDTTTLDYAFNGQTDTTYTLALTDNYGIVTLTNASPITLTVPPNSSVAFPVGANITIIALGAGQVTVAEGSGVTIRSAGSALKLTEQYSTATLIKIATDTWLLVGDITK